MMNKFNYYKSFLITSIILSLFGLYMVTSSSMIWSEFLYDDKFYYAKKQLLFVVIGFVILFIFSKLNIEKLKKYSKKLLIIGFILLALVLIPGLGVVRGGSRSWFGIGSFAFQPAELFKYIIIVYVASKLDDSYFDTKYFFKGIVPIMLPCLIGFALIMLQPDLGTGIVIVLSIVILTFISRAKLSNYVKIGLIGLSAGCLLILSAPYRLSRIEAFINPFLDPLGSGFQTIQSLYAIGPGGLIGVGIDQSIQKHFFLPEPQTDFIFAIICEEFGFIGASLFIFLFIFFLYSGYKIALKQDTLYRTFLVFGFVILITVQTLINLSVVVGLIPVTGITLPFISYGGSSQIILMMMVGTVYATKTL